jgi:hypothetical protein
MDFLDSPVSGWDLFALLLTYTRGFGEPLLRQGLTNANRNTVL